MLSLNALHISFQYVWENSHECKLYDYFTNHISPDTTRSFKFYPPKPTTENHFSFQNISHSLYPFFAVMIDATCLKILSLQIQDLLYPFDTDIAFLVQILWYFKEIFKNYKTYKNYKILMLLKFLMSNFLKSLAACHNWTSCDKG